MKPEKPSPPPSGDDMPVILPFRKEAAKELSPPVQLFNILTSVGLMLAAGIGAMVGLVRTSSQMKERPYIPPAAATTPASDNPEAHGSTLKRLLKERRNDASTERGAH